MDLITFDEGEIAFDETNFAEGESNGEPWLETPAKLFKTGRHKGQDYNEAHLDKMAASAGTPKGARDWKVPLQLDHNHSALNTRGHLREAHRDGQVLRGTLRFCGEDAVKGVKSGNYSRLSVSLRPDLTLHHVAVTPFPYLTDAAIGFSAMSAMDPDVAEAIKAIAQSLKPAAPSEPTNPPEEDITVAEDAKKKAESPPESTPTPATTEKAEVTKEAAPAASFASIEDLKREFDEKTAAQQAQINTLLADNAEAKQALHFSEMTAVVNEFSEAGKTLPVMRDAELAFVQTLDDNQLGLYRAYKEAQPPLVDFGVRGMQDSKKPGGDAETEAEAGAARARARQESKGGK